MLSAACRLRCDQAALAAIQELAGKPDANLFNQAHATKFLQHPEDISDPEDHALFYSLEENFDRLSFLNLDGQPTLTATDVDRASWIFRRGRYNLKRVIEELADNLNSLGISVLLADLTHRDFLHRNLFCLKAIMPGLYPMWFGYYGIRFTMTRRLQRLYATFFRQSLHHLNQVNLDIHPFD